MCLVSKPGKKFKAKIWEGAVDCESGVSSSALPQCNYGLLHVVTPKQLFAFWDVNYNCKIY